MTKNGSVISVFSSKGGCGKSFYSAYTPIGLVQANPDLKILVIDFCKNSSVAYHYGVDRKTIKDNSVYEWFTGEKEAADCIQRFGNSNIYFMPSNSKLDKIEGWAEDNLPVGAESHLKRKIQPLREIFDVILLDNHPSQNSPKTYWSILASTTVLITAICEIGSLKEVFADISTVNQINGIMGEEKKVIVGVTRVEHTKGDKTIFENFKGQLVKAGLPEENVLPYIRYSSSMKNQTVKSILTSKKLETSKHARNVMADILNHAKEVIAHVSK
jgi:cellulose biosynthesis protein BcsQ